MAGKSGRPGESRFGSNLLARLKIIIKITKLRKNAMLAFFVPGWRLDGFFSRVPERNKKKDPGSDGCNTKELFF